MPTTPTMRCLLLTLAALGLCSCAKPAGKPATSGRAAVFRQIKANPVLQREWNAYGVAPDQGSLLQAKCAPAKRQKGAWFYLEFQYQAGELAALQEQWQSHSPAPGTLAEPAIGAPIKGIKIPFISEKDDGAKSWAVIDMDSHVVHYYAYAGDS